MTYAEMMSSPLDWLIGVEEDEGVPEPTRLAARSAVLARINEVDGSRWSALPNEAQRRLIQIIIESELVLT